MKTAAMLIAGLLALSAEAPPAAVRHLEYSFQVYPTARITGGGTGTVSIDILGTAPDGGTFVRAQDTWSSPWSAERERAVITCEVYDGGGVLCDRPPYGLSPAQRAIFALLAHDFFANSAGAQWKRTYSVADGLTVVTESDLLAPSPGSQGNLERISSQSVLRRVFGGRLAPLQKAYAQTDIVYDRTAQIPIFVHDVITRVPTDSVFTQGYVDLRLIADRRSGAGGGT